MEKLKAYIDCLKYEWLFIPIILVTFWTLALFHDSALVRFLTFAALLGALMRVVYVMRQLVSDNSHSTDLLESIPDALLIINIRGDILMCNKQAGSLFAYDTQSLTEIKLQDLIPPQFREGHDRLLQHTFKNNGDRPFRVVQGLEAIRKDGHCFPVDISITFTQFQGQQVALASIRDMTELKQIQDQLRKQTAVLDKAQQITQLGSWTWNCDAQSFAGSKEFYRILGLETVPNSESKDLFLEKIHPDDRINVQSAIQSAKAGQAYTIEHRIVSGDQAVKIVRHKCEPEQNEKTGAYTLVGTIRDITRWRESQENLKLAKVVFDNSLESILVLDAQGTILEANDAFCDLCGFKRAELINTMPSMLSLDKQQFDFQFKTWPIICESGSWHGEVWGRNKNGAIFPCLTSVAAVKDNKGNISQYVLIILNISEIKHNQDKLEQLAHFDQLTGLANRILFYDRLRTSLSRCRRKQLRLGIVYVDLDGFKAINDSLGHGTGDQVLIEVAARLKNSVREDDTVARLGGDEFVVLLNDIPSNHQIELVVNRICNNLKLEIAAGLRKFKVTASIGIAVYPVDGTNQEELLSHADTAMYQSKKLGKNTYSFYNPELKKIS